MTRKRCKSPTPQDVNRELASKVSEFSLRVDENNVWTWTDNGVVLDSWKESDRPGYGWRLLDDVLCERHAAQHVAKDGLGVHVARKGGGEATAVIRKAEAEERTRKVKAEAAKLRADNPRLSNKSAAEILAQRGHGSEQALRRLLGKRK
jgi:hypothetical protein